MSNCRENNKPLVSVIVLAYNAEKTLDATLASLVEQQCDFDYEIVIGEDASTDKTRRIAEKWLEKYPDKTRLMPKAPNKGVVKNYFDCFEACRGKYVTDCSAGDRFSSPHRLQKLASEMEKEGGLVYVFTDAEGYEADAEQSVESYLSSTGREQMILSTVMYRASVLRRVLAENREMVENEEFGCEDLGIVCALIAAGEGRKIDEPTFYYEKIGESVSRPRSAEKEMRFHLSTLYAKRRLAEYYNTMTPRVVARMQNKLNHLADIAFFRFDRELYKMWKEAYGIMRGVRGVRASAKHLFIEMTRELRR